MNHLRTTSQDWLLAFGNNECVEEDKICKTKLICVNNEGFLDCDRSCETCDDPDICKKCAPGYIRICEEECRS